MPHIVNAHGRWWLVLVAAALLIAGHGIVLYFMASHVVASASIVAGVGVLILVKHLGLLAPLYGIWQRARRKQ
jgi:hypothetical protein